MGSRARQAFPLRPFPERGPLSTRRSSGQSLRPDLATGVPVQGHLRSLLATQPLDERAGGAFARNNSRTAQGSSFQQGGHGFQHQSALVVLDGMAGKAVLLQERLDGCLELMGGGGSGRPSRSLPGSSCRAPEKVGRPIRRSGRSARTTADRRRWAFEAGARLSDRAEENFRRCCRV